jgi:hypothetical protein
MYRDTKPIFPPYGSHAERRESRIFRIEHDIYLLGYGSWWPLELMFLESPLRRLPLKGTMSKWTLCETARRSENRLQDHPTVHNENHEKTQHAAKEKSACGRLAAAESTFEGSEPMTATIWRIGFQTRNMQKRLITWEQ